MFNVGDTVRVTVKTSRLLDYVGVVTKDWGTNEIWGQLVEVEFPDLFGESKFIFNFFDDEIIKIEN